MGRETATFASHLLCFARRVLFVSPPAPENTTPDSAPALPPPPPIKLWQNVPERTPLLKGHKYQQAIYLISSCPLSARGIDKRKL